jgi:hypothetical protein
VVRDGRLTDPAAVGEVAGADRAVGAELPQDRQSRGVGGGLQEQDVRFRGAFHGFIISNAVDIDNCRYMV